MKTPENHHLENTWSETCFKVISNHFFLTWREDVFIHDVQKTSNRLRGEVRRASFRVKPVSYPMTDPWDDCIPGTCLSSILVVEPSKTRSFPIKTRVIWVTWVPGIYTP